MEGDAAATSRAPKPVGKTIAERLKEKGITRVVFDRNGFLYHGRVSAVAEAARAAGWSSRRGTYESDPRKDRRLAARIKDTVVSINRVTKVVKGGKNLSFSALVVVGDGHGVVGYGVGKAKEVPSAIKKGIEAAKKNLIRVPLKGSTIPHQVVGRSAPAACCSSRRRTAPGSSPAARCARWSRPPASPTC